MKQKIIQSISTGFVWASALELYFVLWNVKNVGATNLRLCLLMLGLIVLAASLFLIGATEKKIQDTK